MGVLGYFSGKQSVFFYVTCTWRSMQTVRVHPQGMHNPPIRVTIQQDGSAGNLFVQQSDNKIETQYYAIAIASV